MYPPLGSIGSDKPGNKYHNKPTGILIKCDLIVRCILSKIKTIIPSKQSRPTSVGNVFVIAIGGGTSADAKPVLRVLRNVIIAIAQLDGE